MSLAAGPSVRRDESEADLGAAADAADAADAAATLFSSAVPCEAKGWAGSPRTGAAVARACLLRFALPPRPAGLHALPPTHRQVYG
jgi:hypothetical protein